MIWIGIDPGKDTGIVVRDGARLIWHAVVEGETPQGCEVVTLATIRAVMDAIDAAYSEALDRTDRIGVAVEGLTKPKGRKGGQLAFINPLDLAAPALILGVAQVASPVPVTVVPPNRNGSGPFATYPHELMTAGEIRKGLNRPAPQNTTLRHARSAWDVAGAATAVRRIELARVSAR